MAVARRRMVATGNADTCSLGRPKPTQLNLGQEGFLPRDCLGFSVGPEMGTRFKLLYLLFFF